MADLPPTRTKNQRTDDQLVKELYLQMRDQMRGEGKVSDYTLGYVASNLKKVFARILAVAATYQPTSRHGIGVDGGIKTIHMEDWMFNFNGDEGGSGGGTGGGDGSGGDNSGGDYGGTSDWAPADEIGRAQAMLRTVAEEEDFGPGDDPFPFVDAVAKRLGGRWGLNGKRGDPNNPSKDVLAWDIPGYKPQIFDVIQDAGGDNKVTWQALQYGQASIWIAP